MAIGSVLGKLFSKGAGNTASKLVSNYGDDIARNLITQYGDDAAKGILSQVGKAATSNLADDVASAAVKQGSKKVGSLGNKIGDALIGASETGLNTPLNVTRAGMRKVPGGKSTISNLYDKTGLSGLDDLTAIGKTLTGNGEGSAIDDVVNAIRSNYGKGNNVDLSDLGPQIRKFRDSQPAQIRDLIDAKDPIGLEKYLKSSASDLRKSLNPTAGQTELAKFQDNLGREIASRIDAGIVPGNAERGWGDLIQELQYKSTDALKAGNTKQGNAYKKLAQNLEAIPADQRSVANLRSQAKDWVDLSKLSKLTDEAGGGGSITNKMGKLPVVGDMVEALAGQPIERGAQKVGEVTRKVGQAFKTGEAQDVLKKGAVAAGGVGTLAMLLGGGQDASAMGQQSMMMGQDPQMAMMGGGNTLSGLGSNLGTGQSAQGGSGTLASLLGGAQQEEPTLGGYTRSQIENAYVAATMDGDTKTAAAFGNMIDLMDNNEARALKAQSSSSKTSSEDKKKESAINSLNQLMGTFQSAGGGKGGFGHLDNLLNTLTFGNFNTNANVYNSQVESIGAMINKALGDTGTMSDSDSKRVAALLPKTTDSPATAQGKLQNLMAMLQS